MDRLAPAARRDRYGSKINRDHSPALAYTVPWISVLIGSLVPQLPIASAVPVAPPLGFMVLLGWQLVRPGLLPTWAGFPLGLFDDIFSGQPLGSAITLWSITMIGLEIVEARFPWRTFALNWLVAGCIVAAYTLISTICSGARIGGLMIAMVLPQLILSVVLFPGVARLVAALDRFRLMRFRVLR